MRHYLEVNNPVGCAHEVDPGIPAWGTSRGNIEEFDTRGEFLERVRQLSGWGFDICLNLKKEAREAVPV